MKMLRKGGSMLVELVVALTIGIVVLLQLSTFLVSFVKHMHGAATIERQALCSGAVLDLLMRDLDSAVDCSEGRDGKELITLVCWRIGERNLTTGGSFVPITWSRVSGRLQRKSPGMSAGQVFGDVLPGLKFDLKIKTMRFVDEHKKIVVVRF
jgi:hypothetical protein